MTHDRKPFQLTRAERDSALWKRLCSHFHDEIDVLRVKNDSDSNDIKATTLLRGEIRRLQRILALADEAGQEARQDEPDGPESAFFPPHGG